MRVISPLRVWNVAQIPIDDVVMALFFLRSPFPRLSCQLFQGKIVEAVTSCSRAVELCERDENNTPDTDALGQVTCFAKLGLMFAFATATNACCVRTVLLHVGVRVCACARVCVSTCLFLFLTDVFVDDALEFLSGVCLFNRSVGQLMAAGLSGT